MQVLFYKAMLWIAIAVLRLVDSIFDLFMILAGVKGVGTEGGDSLQNLLSIFTENTSIVRIFAYIALVGIGVGAIFTIIAMAKNMATGKKTQTKIFGQYLASILGMIVALVVISLAIAGVSITLGLVDNAFTLGNGESENLSIGSRIISSLVGQDVNIYKDMSTNSDISISEVVDKIVGVYKEHPVIGWEDINKELQPGSDPIFTEGIRAFPYFTAILCSGVLLWCSFGAVLGLIVRLFDIVFLQMALPLSLSCYPLDDGARFRLWKETMISKLVLAFGTILAVNIYIVLVKIIPTITISDKDSLNRLFQVLLIVCGGFTISAGQLLFARLMGTDASEGRQMAHNFRNAIGGLGTTWGLMKGAGRLAFGSKPLPGGGNGALGASKAGTNILGRQGGFLGAAQKAGRVAGTLIAGNRYRAGQQKLVDGIRGNISKTVSRVKEGGGLIGLSQKRKYESGINKAIKKDNLAMLDKFDLKLQKLNEKQSNASSYLHKGDKK